MKDIGCKLYTIYNRSLSELTRFIKNHKNEIKDNLIDIFCDLFYNKKLVVTQMTFRTKYYADIESRLEIIKLLLSGSKNYIKVYKIYAFIK